MENSIDTLSPPLKQERQLSTKPAWVLFPNGTPYYIWRRYNESKDAQAKEKLLKDWTEIMAAEKLFPRDVLPENEGERYSPVGGYVRTPEDQREDYLQMYTYIRRNSKLLGQPLPEDVFEFHALPEEQRETYLENYVAIKEARARISVAISSKDTGKMVHGEKTELLRQVDDLELQLGLTLEEFGAPRLKDVLGFLRKQIEVVTTSSRRTSRSAVLKAIKE